MSYEHGTMVRDAEGAFLKCATLLFSSQRRSNYQERKAALSQDARRLAILLLARHCFPDVEWSAPKRWEGINEAAGSLEKKEKESLTKHFLLPREDRDPQGIVDAVTLSEVGFFYERMKDFNAGISNGEVQIRHCRLKKKSRGIYFTPLVVCDFMVRRALEPALEKSGEDPSKLLDVKLIDPSMGIGQFLLAASEVFVKTLAPSGIQDTLALRRKVFESCLFGIELDKENVEIARFLLGLYVGLEDSTLPGILQGDALIDSSIESSIFGEAGYPEEIFSKEGGPFDGFDAVVGNPPYVAAKNQSLAKYKPLPVGSTQADFYLLFIHKYAANKFLRPGGAICFIVPDPLLLRANAEGARYRLIEGLDLEFLLHIKGVFPRTSVANVIFLARNSLREKRGHIQVARLDTPRRARAFRRNGESFLKKISREIPREYFIRSPRKEFRYLLTGRTMGVLKHLHTARPPRLGPGVVVRTLQNLTKVRGTIFRGEEVGKDRIRDLTTRESENHLPMLIGGESISKYAIREDGLYISPKHVKKDLARYCRHKIVLQKSTGRIVAALDSTGFVFPQSVYGILIDDPRVGYPFLLTQLNSRLLNYFMHVMYTGYKLLQPQIEIEDLRKLPVMVPEFDEPLEVRSSSLKTAKSLFSQYLRTDDPGWILEYVDDNIKLGSRYGSAMIHDLLDFLGAQILTACTDPRKSALPFERLGWLIDLVIYKVFGLGLEEIETVESYFEEAEEEEQPGPDAADLLDEERHFREASAEKSSPPVFGESSDSSTLEAGSE